jgi:hypothetical protein
MFMKPRVPGIAEPKLPPELYLELHKELHTDIAFMGDAQRGPHYKEQGSVEQSGLLIA